MKKIAQVGSTFVEVMFIVVIVCGISAFLIPRSLNQTSSARTIAMSTLSTALTTTVMLAKTEYKIEGGHTLIRMSGRQVKVAQGTGFPEGSPEGIGAALNHIHGFIPTFGQITTYNFSSSLANCNVTYDSSTGIVTAATQGC
ncbi:MAG TPA: hypothetical protein VGV92_07940 [Gammaproteobacteria bacterium]|nr:hypothetical protein [Gammaproteobacteria bacterium]